MQLESLINTRQEISQLATFDPRNLNAARFIDLAQQVLNLQAQYVQQRTRVWIAAVNAHGGAGIGNPAADEIVGMLDRVFDYSL